MENVETSIDSWLDEDDSEIYLDINTTLKQIEELYKKDNNSQN